MSQPVIRIIQHFSLVESAAANKLAVLKRIPHLQRVFGEIMNWERAVSEMFFRRQMEVYSIEDLERWNVVGKAVFFVCGVFFTSNWAGEILMKFFESVFQWLRSQRELKIQRDIFLINEEIKGIIASRDTAFFKGDWSEAQRLTVEIQIKEEEMLCGLNSMRFGAVLVKGAGN